jgi:hypothetical protein
MKKFTIDEIKAIEKNYKETKEYLNEQVIRITQILYPEHNNKWGISSVEIYGDSVDTTWYYKYNESDPYETTFPVKYLDMTDAEISADQKRFFSQVEYDYELKHYNDRDKRELKEYYEYFKQSDVFRAFPAETFDDTVIVNGEGCDHPLNSDVAIPYEIPIASVKILDGIYYGPEMDQLLYAMQRQYLKDNRYELYKYYPEKMRG